MRRLAGSLLLLGLLLPGLLALPGRAQDLGTALKRFVHDEARATFHIRSFFEDRTNPAPPANRAWAGGGWVGLQTGWLYGILQLGGVGYTTQPLWAPQGAGETSDGTLLLKAGGYGFFTLGQAYVSARAHGQTFTAYRQLIDELEVNPNDDRMIPNTFEAYALRGSFGPVSYFAGYVAAMKPRDYSAFINMGERAGAPNVDAGMGLIRVAYGTIDAFRFRTGAYYVPDILTSSYTDLGGTLPVGDQFKIRLSGQFMVQGSNGLHLLTGKPFSTFSAGGRAEALWGPLSLWFVYTQTGSTAAWRNPYGQWIGYTKQLTLDFDRAGERAFQGGLRVDFAGLGLPGLLFLASATFGDGAIDAATRRPLSRNNEYDLDLILQGSSDPMPGWLRPLSLRGRAGFVDQFAAGARTSLTEFRVILNYEIAYRGDRR